MLLSFFTVSQIKIQSDSGCNHQETQDLSHGEGEKNEPELGVGLTKVFDAEPDDTVADEIKGQHGAFRAFEFTDAPQYGK